MFNLTRGFPLGAVLLGILAGTAACEHGLITGGSPQLGGGSETPGAAGTGSAPGMPGTPGGGGGSGSGPKAPPFDPNAPPSDCETPGPRMVRRLTATQYRNSLVELFGDPAVPAEDVLTDPHVLGFHVDADAALVRDLDAELIMNYAERVAAWAAEQHLPRLAPCSSLDEGCRRQFIRDFGRKAHREPLPEDRVLAYDALFAAESTFEAGATVVMTAMLQSPYLLYRRELGQPDPAAPDRYQLTPFELASQLAYLLTESAPDDELLQAAENGRLTTSEDLEREANRLLQTPQARSALAHFVGGWLEIDGLPRLAKDETQVGFPAELRSALLNETHEFFLSGFFEGGDVRQLFSATHSFLNRPLAEFYGVPGPSADGFQRVELAGSGRAPGLLGHGAVLASHALANNSSPVQRGLLVRERLLCQDLPPVPENLDTNLDAGGQYATNRERYRQHSEDPVCSACHQLMDPVGFTFEHYDGFGRRREDENGTPIDASGALSGMPEGDVALDGVESLSAYLAESEAVRSCLVRYWSYYAHGRDGWENRQCNHDAVRRVAGEQGYTLRSVLLGIVQAPHFQRRVQDQ